MIPAGLAAGRYWFAFMRPVSVEVGSVAFVAALAAGIQARLDLIERVFFCSCQAWLDNWFAINAVLALDFAKSLAVDFGWHAIAWHALAVFALASVLLDDVNACKKDRQGAENENQNLVDLVGH